MLKHLFLTFLLLCALFAPSCASRAEPIAIAPGKTLSPSAPLILTGHETSGELQALMNRANATQIILKDTLAATKTYELQSSLDLWSIVCGAAMLATIVACFFVGFNKLDIGLALGFGGCIVVLQGLSWVAPYRYWIGGSVLIITAGMSVVYFLRGRSIKNDIKSLFGDLKESKNLLVDNVTAFKAKYPKIAKHL